MSIPFIRAAAIAPIRRWLTEHGRDPRPFLERAGLAWVPQDDPYLPIPLRFVVGLIVEVSRAEGPDAPHRIVNGRGGFELGLIGAAAFREPTMRDGLHALARAMPQHCTHEIFSVTDELNVIHVRDGWVADIGNAEARHLVQQYVAALIEMFCSTVGAPGPCVSSIAMVPHPETGLRHLRPWLGDRLRASDRSTLDIAIASEAAETPIPSAIREAALQRLPSHPPKDLRPGQDLSDDVIYLAMAMLGHTPPTLDIIAAAAGLSKRTLRRRLGEEGKKFSDLVEKARAETGLRRLREEPSVAFNELSRELGYANHATFSRSVRRWTGMSPRDFRKSDGT